MTTKIHTAVDGNGRPLAVVVTGGQRNDQAMLASVLDEIVVPRLNGGRARSRPDALIADRAYSSGAARQMLRGRKITAVIPQKRDEIAARQQRGQAGGRPPGFDETRYKQRNLVERSFALLKQWRALATRYDCDDEPVPPRGRGLTRVTTGLRCLVFDLSTARPGRCLLPSGRPGVSP